MTDDALLAEQLEYYRQRAGEYDEWWERRGRYDRGPLHNARWRAEIDEVRSVFDELAFEGDVVELAPGTGYWTELLSARARSLTALDGSPEMIAVNRARLGAAASRVRYRQVDLFAWEPERRWDALVFCFWISHVPGHRLPAFLNVCRRALVDGGTVFFLDGLRRPESTAADHVLPEAGSEVMVRRLNNGREFHIVKNFHEPDDLVALGVDAGFELRVEQTDTFFQYGHGLAR